MSEPNTSVWKSFFWVMLLALIGVYALYHHYTGSLHSDLDRTIAELGQVSRTLKTTDGKLDESVQEAQAAQQQIQRLIAERNQDKQTLQSRHEQAVASLKDQHAKELATVKDQHNQAITAVQADLASANQAKDDLQKQIEELAKAKGEVEDELATTKESESSLRTRLVDVAETQKELQAKLDADNKTIAGLNFELNTANQLEAALRDKLERGAARQKRLQTLVDTEEAAINELKSKLVATTQKRESLQTALNDEGDSGSGQPPAAMQEELAKSQATIAQLREELAAAAAERKDLTSKLVQGKDSEAKAPEGDKALQQRYDRAKAQAEQLSGQVKQLQGALDAKTKELESAQQGMAAAGSDADKAAKLQAELQRLRAQQSEQAKELQAAKADAVAASAALEQERDALQTQIGKLKGERARALKAVEERVTAAQAKLDQERTALTQQLELVRSQREQRTAEAESQSAKLSEGLAAARGELAKVKQEQSDRIEALNAKLADADKALADLRAEMQAKTAQHQQELANVEAASKASLNRVQSLYDSAAELGGSLTDGGIRLSLAGDELQFQSGAATLPDRDLPTLDQVAALLKQRPDLHARVEGHTDSSGSAQINQELSQKRAEAVMQALVSRGVDPDRITAKGYGADHPIASNANESGRSENRRVEIYVIQ